MTWALPCSKVPAKQMRRAPSLDKPEAGDLWMIDAALLAKLKTYDTPTICNALELIDKSRYLTGFTTKPLVCPFPSLPPIVGYAKTVTHRSTHANELDPAKAREQRIAYYEYVASQPAPSIMVMQDLDGAEAGFG